jgi:hypothetical protein
MKQRNCNNDLVSRAKLYHNSSTSGTASLLQAERDFTEIHPLLNPEATSVPRMGVASAGHRHGLSLTGTLQEAVLKTGPLASMHFSNTACDRTISAAI